MGEMGEGGVGKMGEGGVGGMGEGGVGGVGGGGVGGGGGGGGGVGGGGGGGDGGGRTEPWCESALAQRMETIFFSCFYRNFIAHKNAITFTPEHKIHGVGQSK